MNDSVGVSVRKSALLFAIFVLFAVGAQGQEGDFAFGVGTVTAPSAGNASGDHFPQSITGGTYLSFSGDYLFAHHFGFGAEVSWRASRNNYLGTFPFRPIFYDFNGVYAPPLGKRAALDLQAGIGAESVRFYQNFLNCSAFTGTCTNYTSSNHFMGHFAAGVKLYPVGHFFVRPEAHLYLVRNNFEFSSARVTRFDVSIGYTFGGQ